MRTSPPAYAIHAGDCCDCCGVIASALQAKLGDGELRAYLFADYWGLYARFDVVSFACRSKLIGFMLHVTGLGTVKYSR